MKNKYANRCTFTYIYLYIWISITGIPATNKHRIKKFSSNYGVFTFSSFRVRQGSKKMFTLSGVHRMRCTVFVVIVF